MSDDPYLFPMAGWELEILHEQEAVAFRPRYLIHEMQSPDEALNDRRYLLTPILARELAGALLAQARLAEEARGRS